MLAEQLDLALIAPGRHGDIMPSNVSQVKAFCLQTPESGLGAGLAPGSDRRPPLSPRDGANAGERPGLLDRSA